MTLQSAIELINKVKKDCIESIPKSLERLRSLGITLSDRQKYQIKKYFKMDKHPSTSSFNLQNASSQDLHQMIKSGNLPSFLNSFQKNRIIELYNAGKTFDAVRKLQGLIEGQNVKPGKSLL